MWQWWTLQYGCYCHTLICRVSNCCLSLCLHIVGDHDRVLENTFGVLENSGIYFGQDNGNPVHMEQCLSSLAEMCLQVRHVITVIAILTHSQWYRHSSYNETVTRIQLQQLLAMCLQASNISVQRCVQALKTSSLCKFHYINWQRLSQVSIVRPAKPQVSPEKQ